MFDKALNSNCYEALALSVQKLVPNDLDLCQILLSHERTLLQSALDSVN